MVDDIRAVSPETEVVCHAVDFEDPWDFEEVYGVLHDFSRAYPFDLDQEDYLVHITTGTHVAQICLFLLTESRDLPGRLIQTGPPRRQRRDEVGSYAVIDLDLSRYDRIATRFQQETRDDISFLKSGIATRNAAFNALIEEIERVAVRSSDPILLMGPTGAGKSQLARRIFELKQHYRRVQGPFVEVNCATLRGDAAMSALFGHEKGAFTGASQARQGLLRRANGGMLFLDEVGDLGLDEQTMLLRAIEEGKFLPLGADDEVDSEFLLICGTNHDLQRDVAEVRFRADLLARINLWTYSMPGLRDRPEDIEPNLDYELDRYAERMGDRVTFNREARERFLAFAASPVAAWTGNFRDLIGAVVRMATLAPGGRVTTEVAQAEIERLQARWRPAGRENEEAILEEVLGPEKTRELDQFDQIQLAEVLKVCRKSKSLAEAGRQLFAVSRLKKKTINDADRVRKYLARFGITKAELDAGSGE